MTDFTAADLIAKITAYRVADAARMADRPPGVNRNAWRAAHPIAPIAFPTLRDTAFKRRPVRKLFTIDAEAGRLFVRGDRGASPRVIEIIDLRAPDADARLNRYEDEKNFKKNKNSPLTCR